VSIEKTDREAAGLFCLCVKSWNLSKTSVTLLSLCSINCAVCVEEDSNITCSVPVLDRLSRLTHQSISKWFRASATDFSEILHLPRTIKIKTAQSAVKIYIVRGRGLEPPQVTLLVPKTSASTISPPTQFREYSRFS
jgi:hypothetical protein